MDYKKTKSGIFVPDKPDFIDISKTIDDNFTQTEKSKYFGLKKDKGIYVPNHCAVKQPSYAKKVAAGLTLMLAPYLTGCAAGNELLSENKKIVSSAETQKQDENKKQTKDAKLTVEPQLFYVPEQKDDTVRTIYSGKAPGDIGIWGLIDINGKGYFALTTADKKIAGPIYAGVEHRSGAFDDFTKVGLMYKGVPFEDGPFVKLKAMQKVGEGDDTDTTLGILVSQDLGKITEILDGFGIEAFLDRDIKSESFYGEATLKYKLSKDIELLLQLRSGGSTHDKPDIDAHIGAGFKF